MLFKNVIFYFMYFDWFICYLFLILNLYKYEFNIIKIGDNDVFCYFGILFFMKFFYLL